MRKETLMFRATLFAAAASAALATAPAFAQTSANPAGTPPAPPIPQSQMNNPVGPAKTAPAQEEAGDLRVSHLIGLNVKNTANETIGEIEDIILDEKQMMKGFIISVGGFLGLGERHVSVAPADIRFVRPTTGNTVAATMNATKDMLKGMPEYRYMSSWRTATTTTAPATAPAPAPTATAPAPRTSAAPAPAGTAAPAPTAAAPAGTAAGTTAAAPAGANMTEEQARNAITAAGYTKVDTLTRDANGAWRAHATRDGKVVAVVIDAQGRVVVAQ